MMRWTYIKRSASNFPVLGNGKRLPHTQYTVYRARYSIAGRLTLTPKSEAIHWTLRSIIFGDPLHRMGGTTDEVESRCPKRVGGRRRDAFFSDGGGGHVGGNEPVTGERPVKKGAA